MADPPEAFSHSFPRSPSEFDSDARISFSRLEDKWVLETEEGTEYEYISGLKRWVPVLDQSLVEEQSQAYKVEGVDTEIAVAPKKRKKPGDEANQAPKAKKPRPNTAVYITNLPGDTSRDELASTFSRCGVIAEEIDTQAPRIKMYETEGGKFKGDALIVYFRPESVSLAVQLLDDTALRLGGDEKMRVQAADRSYKSQQEAPGAGPATKGIGGKGVSGSSGAMKVKRDQKKVIKKTEKMNSKLADWSDSDTPPALSTNPAPPDPSSKYSKLVILKHIFTLSELDADPAALLDIADDIRSECAKLGPVTNVVLYDLEADGVVSVRFKEVGDARRCVGVMDGRWFGGRKVVAYTPRGPEGWRKSGRGQGEEDGEGEERLDKFGAWLEGEGNGNANGEGEGKGEKK